MRTRKVSEVFLKALNELEIKSKVYDHFLHTDVQTGALELMIQSLRKAIQDNDLDEALHLIELISEQSIQIFGDLQHFKEELFKNLKPGPGFTSAN